MGDRSLKEHVLATLAEAEDYISGEAVSRAVNKSRTAVWQAVEELRQLGYAIDAAPRRGYRLLSRPDRLYPWEVAPYLTTAVIGHRMEYHASVGSTNDVAKSLAKEGAPEGLVVVAEEQQSGKGRRGRSWSSPFGRGVWSSTVLRPDLPPYEAPKVALWTALATVRAIEEVTGLAPEVKWPNDVLVHHKKVCGILVEMDAEIDRIRFVVIGVGINANLEMQDIPEEARPHASSLMMELGSPVDRRRLLAGLLNHLEVLYEQWQAEGFGSLLESIRARTGMLGTRVVVMEASHTWEGTARDISADGALLVEADDGTVRPVYAAEVSIRRLST